MDHRYTRVPADWVCSIGLKGNRSRSLLYDSSYEHLVRAPLFYSNIYHWQIRASFYVTGIVLTISLSVDSKIASGHRAVFCFFDYPFPLQFSNNFRMKFELYIRAPVPWSFGKNATHWRD